MKIIEVTASSYGIAIHLPNAQTYEIGWWQIEKDGFTSWHNHLSEKEWFSDEVSRRFTDLCMERTNSAYFI